MVYVIIILAISLMIGPILWLRPTPRERHVMKLRSKAMSLGMKVDCPGIQHYKWAQNNQLIDKKRFVRYTLPFTDHDMKDDDFRPFKGTYFRWIYRGDEEWQWHEVAANQLDKVPGLLVLFDRIKTSELGVVAIELGFKSCSIFWHEEFEHENGNVEPVGAIKEYLESLGQVILEEIKKRKQALRA